MTGLLIEVKFSGAVSLWLCPFTAGLVNLTSYRLQYIQGVPDAK